jgi:hypothetical protein
MSIKIYDGLRHPSPTADVFVIARIIRSVLEPMFFDAVEELLANPHIEETSPALLSRRIDEEHRSPSWSFSDADIGYDVTLLRGARFVLVLVHGEKSNRYVEALVKSGGFKPYGYWDNTDPEEGCTDHHWEQRRQEWGIALSNPTTSEYFDAAPSEVGLSIRHPGSIITQLEMINRTRAKSET